MKIKGVTKQQIIDIARSLGFRWDNDREQGNYHLGVLRMAHSAMSVCGERAIERCTRKVHKSGDHISRDHTGRILQRWPMEEGWVHPAYRYRKRGFAATYRGSDAFGGNGAVCFHGHKKFMEEIFRINPTAIIRTTMAAYLGLADFNQKFPAVGSRNTGSMMSPMAYEEACDCPPEENEHEVLTGTLQRDGGLSNVRMIKQSSFGKCRFTIFNPDHYRDDGTCKCDDPEHRKYMIENWEYSEADFAGIPLRGQA